MGANECAAVVKQIITEKLGIEPQKLAEDLSFQEDLGVDSLDLVEVFWAVEKKFKLTIPDEELEQLRTIGQLVEYVHDRAAA